MAKAKSRSKKNARWRVLVVDDQPLLRRGLSALIDSDPDLSVSGQFGARGAALEAIAVNLPHLVTLDLTLQDGDGLDLIKDIQVRYPELPMLVISMHDESIYAERAFRAGARGFVTKLEGEETVLVAIREVLQGKKYISPRMVAWFAQQYLEGRAKKQGTIIGTLSDRELEVFRLLGEHRTRGEISRRLKLSVKTVETYRAKIKEKLGLSSGSALAERASRWVATGRDD